MWGSGVVLKDASLSAGNIKTGVSISNISGSYTSDADGIRHSMLEESSLSFSDAKFMLVACSGFINYVLGRCAEDSIEIKG